MLKIIIYHDNYRLPGPGGSTVRKLQKTSKREDSLHRSLRRTKTSIQDIMLSNRFDLWCTFTYNCRNCLPKCDNRPCTCSPANCKRYDLTYTNRVLRQWFANQRRNGSPDLTYLAVPEYHKNGAIHFHCLMSGFNGRLKDSKLKTKHGQTIYNASGYYSGWTEFVRIGERFDSQSFAEDYAKVSNYLTKYITKDMPIIHGKRRYLVSDNLKRPITTVNGIASLQLKNIVYRKKPKYINGYLEVQEHKKTGAAAIPFLQSKLF